MWSENNVTTLCTPACAQSVQLWNKDVQQRCIDETIIVFGKAAPADSISGRYSEGLKIACSQPEYVLYMTCSPIRCSLKLKMFNL